ncbi:MAG: hypothetical protein KKE73_04790 [Proteobacteria bacterium]|nr:hypothetical protein [Pseudomonadota bacterium]
MIKSIQIFLVGLSLFVAGAVTAPAADPGVVLLYTGNSLGKYQACPTCGQSATGGLDRRATVLAEQRAGGGTVFTLAGGYELSPYSKNWNPVDGHSQALVRAYTALEYDLGVLTSGDQESLSRTGLEAPKGFVPAGDRPEVRVLTKGSVRLGVLICPELRAGSSAPGPELFAQLAATAAQVRQDCDVVIAISTWGERNEAALLEAHPGVADVLLGSGPGVGAGVRLMNDGATMWLRPEFEGRSVLRLELTSFLDAGKWEGESLAAVRLPLDHLVKGDGRISALFAWI